MMTLRQFVVAVLVFAGVAAAQQYQTPDCVNGPLAKEPICDPNASIDVRAQNFLSKLNTTEKISRLYSGFGAPSPAIPRLGVPQLQWINDALHGLTCCSNFQYVNGDGPYNSSTSFPSPINFAATFNDKLVFALGDAIGIEARAFTNAGRGGVDLWTPNINPFRDPRWGRGQEVPGEDPYVGARYAYNFVQGMQGGEDPRYYKAVADCKHYAAYDLEDWGGVPRTAFSANVGTKELLEYFLPPFESCIRDARAGSIMCSYNALNEVPTCANDFLLQTVARELWEYDTLEDGWIVSDCDAVSNIYDSHHYRTDPAAAAAVALQAGCDLDCGAFYRDHLPDALTKGMITEGELDRSILRLTKSLIRMGWWDPADSQPYRKYGIEHVNTQRSWEISYQAAVQSQTLLKNDGTLPLDATKKMTVAVIGALANDTYYIQGNYRGKPSRVITIQQGIKDFNPDTVTVNYVKGCDVESNDTSGFDAAVKAAQNADYTIYVGGITEQQEAEGHDRRSLEWPGVQSQLIDKLKSAVTNPLIVLVIGGGQVDVSDARDSSNVGAIIWTGYPSQEAGRAVADVLFGKYAISGRLTTTSYPASYTALRMDDMQLRPNKTSGNPGRTYLWYTGEPVFPFGYGLQYTSFEYDFLDGADKQTSITSLSHSAKKWDGAKDKSKAPFITYVANVTNTGNVASATSVLLFLNSTVPDTPMQQLIGFERVDHLEPGHSVIVYFDVSLGSVATIDDNGDRWLMPGEYNVFIGHAGEAKAMHTFNLVGDAAVLQEWPRVQQKAAQIEAISSVKVASA